jgi:hypothetical protein
MPGVALLVAAVVTNYAQHRRRRPTICSTTRRYVPKVLAGALLSAGFSWLLPHVLNGYPKESR